MWIRTYHNREIYDIGRRFQIWFFYRVLNIMFLYNYSWHSWSKISEVNVLWAESERTLVLSPLWLNVQQQTRSSFFLCFSPYLLEQGILRHSKPAFERMWAGTWHLLRCGLRSQSRLWNVWWFSKKIFR